jgi:mono/diheme cytochrome c family protein
MKKLILLVLVVVLGVSIYFYQSNSSKYYVQKNGGATSGRSIQVAVVVPDLSGNAAIGEKVFNAKCVACHGENAGGLDGAGPPFIHKIYEPSHHGDQSFVIAARNGVKSHHWRFGDMPPVEGITDTEISAVIDYVRALQRENDIN